MRFGQGQRTATLGVLIGFLYWGAVKKLSMNQWRCNPPSASKNICIPKIKHLFYTSYIEPTIVK
jgi:hypothetical protein